MNLKPKIDKKKIMLNIFSIVGLLMFIGSGFFIDKYPFLFVVNILGFIVAFGCSFCLVKMYEEEK